VGECVVIYLCSCSDLLPYLRDSGSSILSEESNIKWKMAWRKRKKPGYATIYFNKPAHMVCCTWYAEKMKMNLCRTVCWHPSIQGLDAVHLCWRMGHFPKDLYDINGILEHKIIFNSAVEVLLDAIISFIRLSFYSLGLWDSTSAVKCKKDFR
jgi:hypothetical protein